MCEKKDITRILNQMGSKKKKNKKNKLLIDATTFLFLPTRSKFKLRSTKCYYYTILISYWEGTVFCRSQGLNSDMLHSTYLFFTGFQFFSQISSVVIRHIYFFKSRFLKFLKEWRGRLKIFILENNISKSKKARGNKIILNIETEY